jgi:uncharacterized membrane protein YhfC
MNLPLFIHFLNAFLMIALPVALAIFLVKKWKLSWRFWLVGGATFILSQVGHIPFNSLMTTLLNKTSLATLSTQNAMFFNAAFLGLSAGLFEELFRYGMYRWWLKDARSWKKGVLAGAGHGGVEAIIFGGLAMLAFFQLTAMRNLDLSTLYTGDTLVQAQAQVSAYWSATWYDSLLGAVERLFTIVIQISLSGLVLQAFVRKQFGWVILAIIYHAIVDAAAMIVLQMTNAYWVEGLVGVFALISLVIIFLLRKPEQEVKTKEVETITPVQKTDSIEPSNEQLDNSKYT